MFRLRPIEGFLIQFIIYIVLWMSNDYVASLLTIVLVVIILAILLISLIVEWIEPSKVPRAYFVWMSLSIAAPILAAAIYVGLMGGNLEWIN